MRCPKGFAVVAIVGGMVAASVSPAFGAPNENANCVGKAQQSSTEVEPGFLGQALSGYNKNRDPQNSQSLGQGTFGPLASSNCAP
jgi:hypothetical protein